jgi:hypothetical protein
MSGAKGLAATSLLSGTLFIWNFCPETIARARQRRVQILRPSKDHASRALPFRPSVSAWRKPAAELEGCETDTLELEFIAILAEGEIFSAFIDQKGADLCPSLLGEERGNAPLWFGAQCRTHRPILGCYIKKRQAEKKGKHFISWRSNS